VDAGKVGGTGAVRYTGDWWQGYFMGMTVRQVLALSDRRVVLCYARPQDGGCRLADNGPSPTSDGAVAQQDPRLLPPMPWGATQLFHGGPTSRVELERLDSGHFVVCFERQAEGRVACNIGSVEEEGGPAEAGEAGGSTLRPFGEALELGTGRLVSVSVTAAGRRFAVCRHVPAAASDALQAAEQRASRSDPVACRWAEVPGGPAALATPRWTEEEPFSFAVAGL